MNTACHTFAIVWVALLWNFDDFGQSQAFAPSNTLSFGGIHHQHIDSLQTLNMDTEDELFALWDDEFDEGSEFMRAPMTGNPRDDTSTAVDTSFHNNAHRHSDYTTPGQNEEVYSLWGEEKDEEDSTQRLAVVSQKISKTELSQSKLHGLPPKQTIMECNDKGDGDLRHIWDDHDEVDDENDKTFDGRSSTISTNLKQKNEKDKPKQQKSEDITIDDQSRLSNIELQREEVKRRKLERGQVKKVQTSKLAIKMALESLDLRLPPSKRDSPKTYKTFHCLSGIYDRLLQALQELEVTAKRRANEVIVAHGAKLVSGEHDIVNHLQTIQTIREEEIQKQRRLTDLALAKGEPDDLHNLTLAEMKSILIIRGNINFITNIKRNETALVKLQESYRCNLC